MRALLLLLPLLAACANPDLPEDWRERVRAGETLRYERGGGMALVLREEGDALRIEHEQGWAAGLSWGLIGLLVLAISVRVQLDAEVPATRAIGGLISLGGLLGLALIGDRGQSLDPVAGLLIDEQERLAGLYTSRAEHALDAEVRAQVDKECSEDEDIVSCSLVVRLEREGAWRVVLLELGAPVLDALHPGYAQASRLSAERFVAGLEAELRALKPPS
ncbi:MAG: hypothetical protein H6741_05245 [Alphaproteobacteria bacterium]|nr:hypothetical protein [Alphaproteobacteria bacterium]MCB9792112.1 hypothetical protein [Alphaproteobacteria bacterium]